MPGIRQAIHACIAADYYCMAEAGILDPEDRLELTDRQIVPTSPPTCPAPKAVAQHASRPDFRQVENSSA